MRWQTAMLIAVGTLGILYFAFWLLVVEPAYQPGNRATAHRGGAALVPAVMQIAPYGAAGRVDPDDSTVSCLGFVEFDCAQHASGSRHAADVAIARTLK